MTANSIPARTPGARRCMGANCLVAVVLLGAAAPVAADAPASADAPNLVANGDFAKVTAGRPDDWQAAGDPATVQQELRAARDPDGAPYAELTCARCDPRTPSSHAMLAQVGTVRLTKGGLYEFSCRIRGFNLRGRSVSVGISDTRTWANAGLLEQLPVAEEWKTCRRVFVAVQDVGTSSRLQFWFNEPGTLHVAAVRIVRLAQEAVEFTDVVPPAGGRNLVPNGSFEAGACGWSSMGAGVGWGDLSRLHGAVESPGGSHGPAFLRIALGGERTPVLYFDYYQPTVRRELHPLAASLGWIPVEKGAAYTLSCDMRASEDGLPAVIGVRMRDPGGSPADHRTAVRLTRQWRRYTSTFRPHRRYVFVFVGPDLPVERAAHVDIDAVQLERGEQATEFRPRADVELALEPSQEAGIFTQGEPAALILRARNHAQSPARVAVVFRVTDFEDKPADLADVVVDVPAGSTVRRDVPIPPDWRGFYRLRASSELAGGQFADLRLAVVPRRTARDSVCGVNHAFTTAHLIRLAAKAGVAWYRDWSLKWQHVEPARGTYRWDVADVQIDRVLAEGWHVLPLLPPFPSADWCSEAPAGLPTEGYPGVRLRQAWAPRDPDDLAAFVEKAAARYKDRIRVWEFLNEPIYTDYALPADHANRYGGRKYSPADYVRLLAVASAAMKRADPTCRVIGGIGSGPRHLTREVIEAGCLKHVDIFNLHMYPGRRLPESYAGEMDELLALMDRAARPRKPVWITEFAYYGADDLPRRPFIPSPGAWSEQRLLDDERQCADYTIRYFVVMLSRGVEKVFLHSGAGGRVNEPNFECPLLAYGGAPRKLFCALAVLTELLGPSPKAVGHRPLSPEAHAAAFETGQRAILIVWREEGARAAAVAVAGADQTACLDAMGRNLPDAPVPLSTSPGYIIAPPGKAKELLHSVRSVSVSGGATSPRPAQAGLARPRPAPAASPAAR